ncbi:MAG: FG-GAP repeat protein [Candidatus Eisenbacteria bacterium]|nr:FG-GAP repeat protein [Candidatus Eisenbacteria bacterium]
MQRTLPLWLVLLAVLGGASFLHTPRQKPERLATRAAAVTEPPGLADEGWIAHAERAIAKKEYEASTTGDALQAPNRAHGLRTWFHSEGIRVADRTAGDSLALLSLRVARLGRKPHMRTAGAGEVRHQGARVEIRRPGWTEWFENSEGGLEQGFTLESRPEGAGPVVVELAVAGATLERDADGDGATILAPGGRRLRYEKLLAFDARGTALAATMEIEARQIRLRVEDEGAAYPITIDPLLTSVFDSRLTALQAGAEFGRSVSAAGDVNGDGYGDVIVGAQMYDAGQADEGAAFVFHGGPGGIPSIAAPAAVIQSNQAGAILGFCVTSAGDVNGDGYDDVVVCDYGYNWGGNLFGAAFVFHGSATGITANASPANANATLKNDVTFSNFAISATSAGDVNGDGYADLIVGCEGYGSSSGAAFLFHGSATGIVGTTAANAATRLTCAQGGARFGRAVACAGDVNGDGYSDVAVGAYRYDSGTTDGGAVFVFNGGPSGIASGNELTASSRLHQVQAGAHLGLSVDGAGDVNGDGYSDLITGSPAGANGQTNEGLVHIVHGRAEGIPTGLVSSLSSGTIESDQTGAAIGSCVRGAGDVNGDGYADVIVGAETWDGNFIDEGGVCLFLGRAGGIPNGSPLFNDSAILEGNQPAAFFGVSVAGAGDVDGDGYADVIVGAHRYDGSATNEGSAFLYRGGAKGLNAIFDLSATSRLAGTQNNSGFAAVVAGAGDVNGDGFSDVLVGAPYFDSGQTDEGAAYLYLGSSSGIFPSTPAATFESNQANAWLGNSVASAGDVNGDGYADVIVGAKYYDAGTTDEGAAFLYLGGASGIANGDPTTASAVLTGGASGALFGESVASAGDVNGDGFPDLIVGASHYDAGQPVEGCAFVFAGGAAGIASAAASGAAWRLESDQASAHFGVSVACAGDVNGDGYADVIVGAPDWDSPITNDAGGVLVFHGGPSGIADGHASNAAATLQSDDNFSRFGVSVAGAGDVNGDGYADVIVGSPQFGASGKGAWFVFHGGPAGVPSGGPLTAETFLRGSNPGDNLGTSVAGVGDVNGDGYADVAIGAPMSGGPGLLLIYAGSATGIFEITPNSTIQSTAASGQLGFSVAGAGDVNADGYADVIAGAPVDGFGRANVFHGGGNLQRRGKSPFATRTDGTGRRVQPWGTTLSPAGFRVNAQAVHPGGRGRVKVEIESCPPGAPFGSPSCTRTISPSWMDAAAPGIAVTIAQDIATPPGSLRRWRARTLRAPYTATAAGITAPPRPAHGPWLRPVAQSAEGDVRISISPAAVEGTQRTGGLAIEPLANPTRGRVSFIATLPERGDVTAELFDVAGRRLASRRWQPAGAGREPVRWTDAPELAAGVYRLRLTQGAHSVQTSMVVIR